MAVRYNPKGFWEDVPTAPKFTPPPPTAPGGWYNGNVPNTITNSFDFQLPRYTPPAVQAARAVNKNMPPTQQIIPPVYQNAQRQSEERAAGMIAYNPPQAGTGDAFRDLKAGIGMVNRNVANVAYNLGESTTPPPVSTQQTGMGELRRAEQVQANTPRQAPGTPHQVQNFFSTQYPNAANMNRPASLDPRNVGAVTPPAVIGQHVDTEMWKNQGRRAWTTPGGAANVVGTPAYNERKAGETWAKSGYDPRFAPKSMSPLLAEYLGISENDRRKYYNSYASYDGKDYTWGLTPQGEAALAASSGGGGYGGYGYGGGGGYSYAKQTPSWFERMLNWRI